MSNLQTVFQILAISSLLILSWVLIALIVGSSLAFLYDLYQTIKQACNGTTPINPQEE